MDFIKNKSMFLLLPLIFDEITSCNDISTNVDELFKEDTDIVNTYNKDLNKPWIEYSIFVEIDETYKFKSKTICDKIQTLKGNSNHYNTYTYFINSRIRTYYCYNIPKEHYAEYSALSLGLFNNVSVATKYKILRFWNSWNHPDFKQIFTYMFNDSTPIVEEVIKEDEQVPDFDIITYQNEEERLFLDI